MSDRANMLQALGVLPWQIMRELADEAEESGEPWLAAGWRALADGRKWPMPYSPASWTWRVGPEQLDAMPDVLPFGAVRYAGILSAGPWPSPEGALLAGAAAIGECLRELSDQG